MMRACVFSSAERLAGSRASRDGLARKAAIASSSFPRAARLRSTRRHPAAACSPAGTGSPRARARRARRRSDGAVESLLWCSWRAGARRAPRRPGMRGRRVAREADKTCQPCIGALKPLDMTKTPGGHLRKFGHFRGRRGLRRDLGDDSRIACGGLLEVEQASWHRATW